MRVSTRRASMPGSVPAPARSSVWVARAFGGQCGPHGGFGGGGQGEPPAHHRVGQLLAADRPARLRPSRPAAAHPRGRRRSPPGSGCGGSAATVWSARGLQHPGLDVGDHLPRRVGAGGRGRRRRPAWPAGSRSAPPPAPATSPAAGAPAPPRPSSGHTPSPATGAAPPRPRGGPRPRPARTPRSTRSPSPAPAAAPRRPARGDPLAGLDQVHPPGVVQRRRVDRRQPGHIGQVDSLGRAPGHEV